MKTIRQYEHEHGMLLKAIALCGGSNAEFAARLTAKSPDGIKVSDAQVWNWINRDKKGVPPEHCIAAELAVDGRITRYQLQPFVFGSRPAKAVAKAKAPPKAKAPAKPKAPAGGKAKPAVKIKAKAAVKAPAKGKAGKGTSKSINGSGRAAAQP